LRDAREHVEPTRTTFRESWPPRQFSTYMDLMTNIIDLEPSSFEEATNQKVWRDAVMEEHNSITRNDVWEIVSRPEGFEVHAKETHVCKLKKALYGLNEPGTPELTVICRAWASPRVR
jgi:hypothetical protein